MPNTITRQADSAISMLYSAGEIDNQVKRLAAAIAANYGKGENLTLIALLKGSFVFAADLVRALHTQGCHPQIDFMTLSSYGKEAESSGTVTVNRDLSEDVTNRDVVIVDDILESGRTLDYAQSLIAERGAKSSRICVLLEKPEKRLDAIDITADYVGFRIPDKFVIGYGLDYANYYRELPYIGVLDDE